MLDFYKYKYIEKSKTELEADQIINNITKKLWDDAGYMNIYHLGAVMQLHSLAKGLKKYGHIDLDTVLAVINTFKDSEGVSDLVNMILEEFNFKENKI